MRILLVADGYPPSPGGLAAHVERLARYLHGAGHEVAVVSLLGGNEEQMRQNDWDVFASSTSIARIPRIHQSETIRLPPPWADPLMIKTIDFAVRKLQPDVIHAHGWCSASAAAISRRSGVPIVSTLHDYGMLCPMRTLLNGGGMCSHTSGPRCVKCPGSNQSAVKRLLLSAGISAGKRSNASIFKYLAVSNAVAAIHRKAGMSGEIEVIPNFIDVEERPISAPPSSGSILYVGPWSPAKGSDVLLESYRILKDQGRTTSVRHVGEPAAPPGIDIQRSGRLQGPELDAAYRSAQVVVVPSIWQEPCPTVALEAMAAGRAVIASSVGGLTDIVIEGVTGRLVPPNDPRALAGALDDLLADPELLASMGLAGRSAVVAFATDKVGPRIEAVYAAATKVRAGNQ